MSTTKKTPTKTKKVVKEAKKTIIKKDQVKKVPVKKVAKAAKAAKTVSKK